MWKLRTSSWASYEGEVIYPIGWARLPKLEGSSVGSLHTRPAPARSPDRRRGQLAARGSCRHRCVGFAMQQLAERLPVQ